MTYGYDDPLAALLDSDVSGEDPFVGAALSMQRLPTMQRAKLDVSNARNLLSLLGSAKEIALNENAMKKRVRIDTLSRTEQLPVTFLGVDSVANIAAGAAANVNFNSVSPVRITNFTVAAAVAPLFLINAIWIGRTNLMMNAVGIPADRFLPDAARPPFESPVLPASVNGIINVTNIAGAPARFLGSFDVIDLQRKHPDCAT